MVRTSSVIRASVLDLLVWFFIRWRSVLSNFNGLQKKQYDCLISVATNEGRIRSSMAISWASHSDTETSKPGRIINTSLNFSRREWIGKNDLFLKTNVLEKGPKRYFDPFPGVLKLYIQLWIGKPPRSTVNCTVWRNVRTDGRCTTSLAKLIAFSPVVRWKHILCTLGYFSSWRKNWIRFPRGESS